METEPSFSIFKNATAKKHLRIITLSQAIDGIRNGEWRGKVSETREVLASQSIAAYKQHRTRTLPLFALSGEMPSKVAGKTLTSHSGLLQGDFDGKDHPSMTVDQMREFVISSPHVVAAFISPSGSGIKAIIRILASVESHRACFHSAERHFAELGLKIDPATKDEKRLCYVSDDPELWSRDWMATEILNPNEKATIEIHECENRQRKKSRINHAQDTDFFHQSKGEKSSIPKHSSPDCHIDDIEVTETQILQIIQKKGKRERERPTIADEERAAKRARAKLSKNERLEKLYRQYIEKKFTPRQGERNAQLVAMVTFLFRAVSEESVVPLAMFYYDINQDIFSDSREQHAEEAENHLRNTKRAWCESLNEDERSWYDELVKEKQKDRENTFRVCRELAGEDGTFFLSCKQLGDRIDQHPRQADRYLKQFIKWRILDEVKRGTQHKQIRTGEKAGFKAGRATVYRWRIRDIE